MVGGLWVSDYGGCLWSDCGFGCGLGLLAPCALVGYDYGLCLLVGGGFLVWFCGEIWLLTGLRIGVVCGGLLGCWSCGCELSFDGCLIGF